MRVPVPQARPAALLTAPAAPAPIPPLAPLTTNSPLARGPQWQLDDLTLQRLAVELARGMYTAPEVLDRFAVDPEIFLKRIRPNPAFEKYYREAYAIWNSAGSAQERVQVKAQLLFEDWLVETDRLYHDKQQPLSGKVELLKTLGKVAGLGQEKPGTGVAPGDRVLIQINLGAAGQREPVIIDKIAHAINIEAGEIDPA